MIAFTSALLLALIAVPQPDHRQIRTSGFIGVVSREFAAWDTDHNGELSADELDVLSVDPKIKGDEAAAVATLKLIVRSNNYILPKLTKEYLATPPERRPRSSDSQDDDSSDRELSEGKPSGTGGRPKKLNPDFQSRYSMSLRAITQ